MKYATFLAGLLLLASCKLNDDVNLALPSQQRYYVVEAILHPGQPMELLFSESNRMSDVASLSFVWFADACFAIGTDTISLTNYLFLRKADSVMINYTSQVPLPNLHSGSIALRLVKDRDTLTATTRFVKPVEVESCTVSGLDITATLRNSYDSHDRFFRVEAFLYQSSSKKIPRYTQLYNLGSDTSPELALHMRVGNVPRDSLRVVVSHISREHYEYLYSCSRAVDAYFDPFAVPTPIKTNISGGLGIFAVVQQQSFLLKSRYP
ncbi:DUF4249 family protein [uncultured Acetobacteroides sp.]|uniref:DUF4249 family protein n=1 Tax=uncultured Acetobacteroides sp. TaxID=1760811 RepID=UPI0029F591B0|nr:DUF4249 family protein [uncultured Acetobacteroides sp.]